MGRKPDKIHVNEYQYNFSEDELCGNIDDVIVYLDSLRTRVYTNVPSCNRIYIDYNWGDGGYAGGYTFYADRLETDEEYAARLAKMRVSAKEAKYRKEAQDLQEFERVKKQYDKLAKKVAKIKNKEVTNETTSHS